MIVVLVLALVYDNQNPDCVEAQTCVTMPQTPTIEMPGLVTRNNVVPVGAVNAGGGRTRYCYLTYIENSNVDDGNEWGYCGAASNGVNWELTADIDINNGNDGYTVCGVTCIVH